MTRPVTVLGLAAILLTTISGCNRDEGAAPPTIHYAEDVCALCGMIVSDERFACAVVAPGDGERFVAIYDDIGDMLADKTATTRPDATIWVHDFDTNAWIDARQAHYCAHSKLVTPMASGIAAFTTRQAAERVAGEFAGSVVDFTAMTANPAAP